MQQTYQDSPALLLHLVLGTRIEVVSMPEVDVPCATDPEEGLSKRPRIGGLVPVIESQDMPPLEDVSA